MRAASTKVSRWAAVSVLPQARENADTEVEARYKWSKIYQLFSASGETEQDEVFAAVTAYFWKNGCSPEGKYRKPVQTAGGKEAMSGEIVKVTGKVPGEIRQFMRGRLHDSYLFLKHNRALQDDEEMATRAENAGVSRSMSWLLADWFGRDCPYFVGDEASVYNALRTSTIAVANRKRHVAGDEVDHVIQNAPESKISAGTPSFEASNSLF